MINFIKKHFVALSIDFFIDLVVFLSIYKDLDFKNDLISLFFIFLFILILNLIVFLYINEFIKPRNPLRKIFKGYSDLDISEIINLTNSLQKIGINVTPDQLLAAPPNSIDIPMESLSALWLDKNLIKEQEEKESDENDLLDSSFLQQDNIFNNSLLNDYFKSFKQLLAELKQMLNANVYQGLRYDVETIIVLLRLLDEKGDCSSVVDLKELTKREPDFIKQKERYKINSNQETDTNSDNNKQSTVRNMTQYEILTQVNLIEHSIYVAINIQDIIHENDWEFSMTIPAIVAALAHDIGKIPYFFNDTFYTAHIHPNISAELLKRIDSFLKIPENRRNAILEAVLNHHSNTTQTSTSEDTKSENFILTVLKQADKETRVKEIKSLVDLYSESIFSLPYKTFLTSETEQTNQQKEIKPPRDNCTSLEMNKYLADKIDKQHELKKNNKLIYQNKQDKALLKEEFVNTINNALDNSIQSDISRPAANKESISNKPITYNKTEEIHLSNIACVDFGFIDDCLFEIGKIVNVVENVQDKNKNTKQVYNSFSFDNTIFIQGDKLAKIYMEMFKKYNCIDVYYQMKKEQIDTNYGTTGNRPFRHGVMRYIGELLFKNDYLAENYIRKGHFGGYFVVKTEEDEILFEKAFYVPINFKALEPTYNYFEIEDRKDDPNASKLKKIGKIEFALKDT